MTWLQWLWMVLGVVVMAGLLRWLFPNTGSGCHGGDQCDIPGHDATGEH